MEYHFQFLLPGGTVASSTAVSTAIAVSFPVGAIAVGLSAVGLGVLLARTGRSNGYWGEKWPGDHTPDHAHLKGEDGTNIRIDKNGNPLAGEPPLTPQQSRAIKNLIEQLRKLFKRFGG